MTEYKLVPVEPTEEMIEAAVAPYRHDNNTAQFDALMRSTVRGYFAAMIAAAPSDGVTDGWYYDMDAAPREHHKICVVWKDRYSDSDPDGPHFTLGYTYWTGTTWANRPSSHWDAYAWAEFPVFVAALHTASKP
jgi:hypothetical protein